MADILIELKRNLSHAQELQVAEANKHRRPHTFQEGDKVFIFTKNLPLTYTNSAENGHHKTLQHKYMGPFELGWRRGENAFEIADMPAHWKLSRTFNVDKLKDASNVDHTRDQDPPPPLMLERTRARGEQAAYEVEEIHSWRRNPDEDGRIEYETKWTGHTQLTWEPAESFRGGGDKVLAEYVAREGVPAQVAPKPKPKPKLGKTRRASTRVRAQKAAEESRERG
jgi:hypothetical protein